METNVLSNLKVVELGEFITAPFCTSILSDWGAEVIKIEDPLHGDKSRQHGPFPDDKPDNEKSGLYLYLNTNKKSITLNVNDPKGRKILKDLLRDADVFVENNTPRVMKELGLDYNSLKKEFPKLIMCSITPYGQTGPYRDFKGHALNASAACGLPSVAGNPNREPLDHPMSYIEYVSGSGAATAIMMALLARSKSGKGQYCDIATFHVMNGYHACRTMYNYSAFKIKSLRSGSHGQTIFYPSGIFPCKDGDYTLFTLVFEHWHRLMDVLGNPEWSKDERFNPPQATSVFALAPYIDELDALLIGELEKWTKADLLKKCREARTPFIPVMDMKDLVESPQAAFRHNFVEILHPVAGTYKYPGAPAIMSETPWKLRSPAPLLGQHNAVVYDKLGISRTELSALKKSGVI